MNRQEKRTDIDMMKDVFNRSEGLFLVGVQGLSVEDIEQLRKGLRAVGSSMRVVKNTLLKKASQDIDWMSDLGKSFKNQIVVVSVEKNTPAAARVLYSFSKENEKVALIAGSFEKRVFDKNYISYIATLPSHEQLIARICGALKSPIIRIMWVLKSRQEVGTQS